MISANVVPQALMASGDACIQKLLTRKDTEVIPAFACRLDGFVNDTFTEYANPSVYRPSSVCAARLVSTLEDTVRRAGEYYLAFSMYTTAGQQETIDIHIGHRCVARAENPDPDNRLHLFVVPGRHAFRGGEPIRLVTGATTGPCRIENLVLLSVKPEVEPRQLVITSPHADVRLTGDRATAWITWIASRPATGVLRWRQADGPSSVIELSQPRTNGEVSLAGLELDRKHTFRLELTDPTGELRTEYEGSFVTTVILPPTVSRTKCLEIVRRRRGGPWPVSVGVPLPAGTLADTRRMRLLQGGDPVPCQSRALAHWDDGSIKWALLDFVADGTSDYTWECGTGITAPTSDAGLDYVESATGITVTTGPIRVEWRHDHLSLPGIVSTRQPCGDYTPITPPSTAAAVTLVEANDTTYQALTPDSITLEETGPQRACVRLDCTHRSQAGTVLFRSTFRIHVFRDSSLIRVLHTVENDNTKAPFTTIRQLSLRAGFDLRQTVSGQLEGCDAAPSAPALLRQIHDDTFRVMQGEAMLHQGQRAAGTAHRCGQAAAVTLAVRDFWQNYPKGIESDAAGFVFHVFPLLTPDEFPGGDELEDRLFYHLRDGCYRLKAGVSRTHEFWFDIQPGGAGIRDAFTASVQHPPLYSVALEAFNSSRTFTSLPSRDPSPYPRYEVWVDAARQAYATDRENYRAYGFHNFGDWYGERTYNWGNMEYDTPWCFLQEYLRGGEPQFYTWAEEAVRHLIDVDTCHHGPHAGWQYSHCVGHVGDYYPDGYRERAQFRGRWSPSHTWIEGPLLYHLLSGDARALEGALKTCGWLTGDILNNYDFTNCRNSGWHLIHLAAAYKATGRRVFLNAARIVADRVLERQRASGGWERLMVPGHCHCLPPRHMGNAGFMVGMLMVGLKRYHEATGDQRIPDAIVRAASYCIDRLWVAEKRSFRYTCCPESSVGGGADMRILKGIAYAYGFSRQARFRTVLEAGIDTALGRLPQAHRGVGKSIGSPMRGAPQVLLNLPEAADNAACTGVFHRDVHQEQ